MRTIQAGKELTFDYQLKGSGNISSDSVDHTPAKKRVRTVCKCGVVTCPTEFSGNETDDIVLVFLNISTLKKYLGLLYYQDYTC
jgi:hypothetical protein